MMAKKESSLHQGDSKARGKGKTQSAVISSDGSGGNYGIMCGYQETLWIETTIV